MKTISPLILILTMSFLSLTSNAQLMVDAGNDLIICPENDFAQHLEYKLGGEKVAWGGIEPYTYTWSGKHFDYKYPSTGPAIWIYASDILDDTTKSNPVITSTTNVPDEWTTYYLKVEDAVGNVKYDSVNIIESIFLVKTIYKLPVTIYRGDSIQLYGDIYFENDFPPFEYILGPSHGLADSTDVYGWAKPDTSISYYLQAINSIGCISNKIRYWHIEVIDTTTNTNLIDNTEIQCSVQDGSLIVNWGTKNNSAYNLTVATIDGKIIHKGQYREKYLQLSNLGLKPNNIYLVTLNDDTEKKSLKLISNSFSH